MAIVGSKVIYPELSYKLLGLAFQIFNGLGYGLSEKYYQRAFEKALEKEKIPFWRERAVELLYDGKSIGRCFLDFIIEDKIVVELKVRSRLGYVHIKQVNAYLKATGYKLALLVYFTRNGVKCRRVLNAV